MGQLKVLVGERASVDRLTPFSPRAAVGKIKNKTDDVRKRVYRAGYSKEIPGTWYEYKITSKEIPGTWYEYEITGKKVGQYRHDI